jgi:hypothetical protein
MTARLARWALWMTLVALVMGCPYLKKKKKADDDASAAVAVEAGPLAANIADISRFNDEAPIDSGDAKLIKDGVNARKTPPNGDVVATLSKGTTVTQIASHDKFFLVTFDDPKDASQRLMGWVIKSAFDGTSTTAAAVSTVKPPGKKCPAGQESVVGLGCKRGCRDDDGCNDDENCSGRGTLEGSTSSVLFCVPDNLPTPPPPQPPPTVRDAGSATLSGGFVVNPPCPFSFVVAADARCHKTCNSSVSECPNNAFCIRNRAASGGKICSASRSL